MAITTAICNSYKQEILEGVHVSTDVYKIALFTDAANLSASTTAYSTTNEVSGTGYTAGGATLSGLSTGLSGSTAYLTFSDPSWANATITARGCLIYNSSKSNKAVAAFDFGQNVTSTNGTFTIDLPAAGASALIRIA
jgi:2-oxoglutarate dehydrogenase complex dehydrogenase (E1) component-like enzyme